MHDQLLYPGVAPVDAMPPPGLEFVSRARLIVLTLFYWHGQPQGSRLRTLRRKRRRKSDRASAVVKRIPTRPSVHCLRKNSFPSPLTPGMVS